MRTVLAVVFVLASSGMASAASICWPDLPIGAHRTDRITDWPETVAANRVLDSRIGDHIDSRLAMLGKAGSPEIAASRAALAKVSTWVDGLEDGRIKTAYGCAIEMRTKELDDASAELTDHHLQKSVEKAKTPSIPEPP